MSKVVRYFHLRGTLQSGGATVKVTGDTDYVGQVDVQVAKCSKKDMYCKRTGRAEVEKAPVKVVPLRYLPNELSRVFAANVDKQSVKWIHNDYTFAIKYFLPKE